MTFNSASCICTFKMICIRLPRYLCRTKDGRHLQLSVILLFPGVNDQRDVAAAVGSKLPECSDDVVLDRKPESHDVPWCFWMIPTQRTFFTSRQDRCALTCLLRGFPGPSWTEGCLWWHGWCHTCRRRVAWCPKLPCQQEQMQGVFSLK